MKRMEEMILTKGQVLDGGVLRVGSFLNQQIDMDFLKEIGEEIKRLFGDSGVTKILTVESSGISIAVGAGMAMGIPAVFAKKNRSSNIDGEVYSAWVRSFTYGKDNHIMVVKDFIKAGEKILIVDDFLAHGSALNGLIAIAEEAGAEVVGCVAAIEKGFQKGGDNLRARGYRVESLAIIDEMSEGKIVFREQTDEPF